jgi:putative hydrolase of the HAD superfamily
MTGHTTILLDVNNTLLGYEDPMGFEKRFSAACQELGAYVAPDDVRQAIRPLVPEWMARKQSGARRASNAEQYRQAMTWFYQGLLINLGVPGDSAQQAQDLYDRFIIREGFMPPYNDVRQSLEQLTALKYRLGILSNFPPHLEDILKGHDLHRYFDFFVVSSVVGMEKPEPAIFELAIVKAGCPKEKILYVGDDPDDDIRGAQRVGLQVILLDRHQRWPDVDCMRITSLAELVAMVS